MFTKVLAINKDASNCLGYSNKLTTRFQPVSCFVFNMFTSRCESEKKAISAPEIKKESTRNTSKHTTSTVVPCGFTASNKNGLNDE